MASQTGGRPDHRGRPARRRWRATALVAVVVLAAATGYALRPQGGKPSSHPSPAAQGASVRPDARSVKLHPAAQPCTVSPALVPSCGAWWGMYVPQPPAGSLFRAVTAQESYLGRPLDIVELYHDMSDTANGIFPNHAEVRLARTHHLLLYSWAPANWDRNTVFKWQEIADGAIDQSVIVPEAERLKALGHPVFLSFSPEADSATASRLGTPAEFVAAWRHIHDVFAQVGASNVIWVWTTEGYLAHASTIAALYPGSSYVDWIGYDPYNFYTCHGAHWETFAQTVEPFYRWLTAHHLGGKPEMLAEFGSSPDPQQPGRETTWYQGIGPVVRALPHIKALVQWNSTVPGCSLQLADGSAAMAAYRQVGLSPFFRQKLP
jgi:Glycosyl hydrolase family 26